MAWPGLGKCTAYPRPGQDSPPLGVRWFSEGLGHAAALCADSVGAVPNRVQANVSIVGA
jgi:hypothetical protein